MSDVQTIKSAAVAAAMALDQLQTITNAQLPELDSLRSHIEDLCNQVSLLADDLGWIYAIIATDPDAADQAHSPAAAHAGATRTLKAIRAAKLAEEYLPECLEGTADDLPDIIDALQRIFDAQVRVWYDLEDT